MDSTHSLPSTSNSKYRHLSADERDVMAHLLAGGTSMRKIAHQIGRSASTISREIARNGKPTDTEPKRYLAHRAHHRAELRWEWRHKRECMSNPLVRPYVIEHLQLGWTPELIAGRISLSIPTVSVSHETIYKYIYLHQPELVKHLAFAHKTRRKRGSAKGKRAPKIPDRTPIDQRPPVVDLRTREGDWEGDTIVSRASSAALAVTVERKTRKVCIRKIENKKAVAFTDAVVKSLLQVPKEMLKTLTLDNGTENVDHKLITESTGVAEIGRAHV